MIVITGASDGLGQELALLYKNRGKRVISLSRTLPSQDIDHIVTDLTNQQDIERAAALILKIDEPLQALINCAGVMSLEPLGSISPTEVERVFKTNVLSAIQLTSLLTDRIKKDSSDIVNVASTVGTKAYPDQAAYGASKWAMRGFSQNLQLELKATKCRVISFCPGGFVSDILKKATGQSLQNPSEWMDPKDLAGFMLNILDLPKNMEVSEVVINRR